jgi:hypothetical protein
VVAKVMETLVVSKQRSHRVHTETFNLKKVIGVSNRFAVSEDVDNEVEISTAWKTI